MLKYLKTIRTYEIIAFTTGFALMAYELAAARLLAPSIGSSTYVWTSVIGVIIAALSIGYTIGGIIADKRVSPTDIAWLLLASALGVSLTLTFADGTLSMLSKISDPRLQGLMASALLFLPASFLLGTISPYLARLRTRSLGTTGRSIASLSAMNAIGGIIGTFCVGFIFFGYVGPSETLFFVIFLLVAASWLISPRHRLFQRLALSLILLIVSLLQSIQLPKKGIIADINTPSARYQIIDSTRQGAPIRILSTGPRGSQSGVYASGSTELVFDYTRQIAQLVKQAPHKSTVLVLGGGALTLPAYLADHHPAQIDVVEIDPHLEDISKKYFNYRDRPNLKIIAQDARAYLNTTQKKYDIIIADVYADTSIPFALTTQQYTQQLRRTLTANGIAIVNAIGANTPGCGPLLSSIHQSYIKAFTHFTMQPMRDPNIKSVQNIISTYSNQPLNWANAPAAPQLQPGQTLTDNYAPIERLQQQCWDEQSR